MSTIFKTRISQQEVQTPTLSATAVVTDNFITSSIQSETVASENINATTVQGEEIIATELNTQNLAVTNDFSPGGDVIVSSGSVLVGKGGTVSFVDDGEVVDENGASGFPVFTGTPEVLNNSTIYDIGLIDKDTDLSGMTFGGNDEMVQTCEIWFATGPEAYNITWPTDLVWLDSTDGSAPAIVVNTEYRVVVRKESGRSAVASIAYALGEGAEVYPVAKELTAEQVQAVVPMSWDDTSVTLGEGSTNPGKNTIIGAKITGWLERNTLVGEESYSQSSYGTAMGYKARTGYNGSSVGYNAQSLGNGAVAIGASSRANSHPSMAIGNSAAASASGSTALGFHVTTKSPNALTIGSAFTETTDSGNVNHTCTTQGTGSITIGAGANTLNNGDTESSNSVTIGCKASNSGSDSVVIGASASNTSSDNIIIGAGANSKGYSSTAIGNRSLAEIQCTAIGTGCQSWGTGNVTIGVGSYSSLNYNVSIGFRSKAQRISSISLGSYAISKGDKAIAIGAAATVNDYGATVIRSTAEDGTYTQLYFSGANTPLANTYENGEAMMGYVVRDSAGNVMTDAEGNAMVGTQKLSVLFPNNRGENAFTPAMLGLDDEWTPKPMFRPSDLDMPQEEPTEPEEYQPLPVYPIVEPEIEEI